MCPPDPNAGGVPQIPDPAYQQYSGASQAQTQVELQHAQERQQAMAPVLQAEEKALAQPTPQAPTPVPIPTPSKEPIVDAHQFQQFSLGMVGLAMIAGGLTKQHWMNATSMLNGAMEGYLQGSKDLAEDRRKQFEEQFKIATQKEEQQNKEYLAALSSRDRSIKDIFAQAEVIAAKYGMVDAQDAIRRRDLDSAFGAFTQRQDALARITDQHTKMTQEFQTKQIARYDKLLQDGTISPEEHDKAVEAIQSGGTPEPVKSTGGMNEKDLGVAIQDYFQNGHMTPLGMRNNYVRNQIIKGTNDLAERLGLTPADVVTGWATHKADMSALMQTDKQQAAVGGFEETARKNLDMLIDISNKLPRTSYSQLLNQWIQYGRVKTGNVLADQFNAALEETLSEYSKVMGGGYGAGASTEGAQARAHSLLGAMSTPEQVAGVADTMRKTMDSRTASIADQRQKLIDRIKGTTSGGGGGNVMRFDAQGNPIQ